MELVGTAKDSVKNVGGDIWSKMNIRDEKEFKAFFVFGTIEFVTSVIETFH